MTDARAPEFRPLLNSGVQPWGPGVEPRRRNWSGSERYQQPTTVIHGSGVIGDLVAGMRHFRQHATDGYWTRLGPTTAGIGCVPWLTDAIVIDELAALDDLCVVIDKQHAGPRAGWLHERGSALSSLYLDGFDELTLPGPDGAGPVIGPYRLTSGPGLVEPVELGPVRVAGWAGEKGARLPLLHSKMLVLGVTTYYEDDEMYAGDIARFNPLVTWMGSANWTQASRRHVEHGLWSTDPALVFANYDYLCGLIALSEDFDSAHTEPTPELVAATWDDDAFREYFAEHRTYEAGEDD